MLKKTVILALTLLMSISLAACGSNSSKTEAKKDSISPSANAQAKGQEQTQTSLKTKKILVAYYSWSGNTREIASQIQKATGGDIVEIQPVVPYSSDYDTVTKQAKQEIESGYKPALKTKIDNINSYDVVFIGSPIWWGTIAPPVATFLSEYDLSGKTVVPFVTHGGGGQGRSFDDIAKLCPQSTILNGIDVFGRDTNGLQDELSKRLR